MAHSQQSALLKQEIEARLAARIPAALSPQPQQAARLISCGVAPIDDLLGGGLPLGGITEFAGAQSSGRTSLAFALLAQASAESACAWIDVDDCFDPRSAAAAGVCLSNLLWVRFASAPQTEIPALKPSREESQTNAKTLSGSRYGHHPRTETNGLDRALQQMLVDKAEARQKKMEGTPGYPNRKLTLASASEEQVRYDHFNSRSAKASDPLWQADQRAAQQARERSTVSVLVPQIPQKQEKVWSRLDKAIRATDQVLQAGGFRVVVLDLASIPPEQALRIPSATWFRFRRAAQESDAIFLLLTQAACARSSASCVLDCSPGNAATSNLLSGLTRNAEVARQRLGTFGKKAPGRVTSWQAAPHWMRAAGK
jgi:recombination protein RecA